MAERGEHRGTETGALFEQLLVELTHAGKLSVTLPMLQELRRRWQLLEHLGKVLEDEYHSIWWDKNKGEHQVTLRHHGNATFISRRKNPIEILERLKEEVHAESRSQKG